MVTAFKPKLLKIYSVFFRICTSMLMRPHYPNILETSGNDASFPYLTVSDSDILTTDTVHGCRCCAASIPLFIILELQ